MKNTIFLLVTLVLCFSCSKEPGIRPGADEREVEMNFLLPSSTRAEPSVTEEEKAINNLTLLVFDGKEKDSKYLYSRYAWRKTGGTFTSVLKIGEGLTIYFAANAPTLLDDLESANVDGDWTWEDVCELLQMDDPQGIDPETGGLPMWGHQHGVEIGDNAGNHLGTIQLIRSVASIDIYMLAGDFDLEEGHVVFAASKGYLPYDLSKMKDKGGFLRAQEPFSPAGYNTLTDLDYTVGAGVKEILNKFYIYENDTALDEENRTGPNRPTKVVLKGIWKGEGASGKSTYYPLTLRDYDDEEKEFVKKQVTRNNKYSLFIKNVHGEGFDKLGEAKDADDVNWDYDVIKWDENEDGEIIVDGSKYFWREASYVKVYREEGSVGKVYFRTNYKHGDIKIKFEDDADYTTLTLDTHDRFKVEVIDGATVSSAYDFFKITAKQPYGTQNNPAKMNVMIGRTTFNIHIEQVNSHPDDWNNGGNIPVDVE